MSAINELYKGFFDELGEPQASDRAVGKVVPAPAPGEVKEEREETTTTTPTAVVRDASWWKERVAESKSVVVHEPVEKESTLPPLDSLGDEERQMALAIATAVGTEVGAHVYVVGIQMTPFIMELEVGAEFSLEDISFSLGVDLISVETPCSLAMEQPSPRTLILKDAYSQETLSDLRLDGDTVDVHGTISQLKKVFSDHGLTMPTSSLLAPLWPEKTHGRSPAVEALLADEKRRFEEQHSRWKAQRDAALKKNSGSFTRSEPVFTPTPLPPITPKMCGAGANGAGAWVDISPARGSSLTPAELGRVLLPVIQKVAGTRDVSADVGPTGSSARFSFTWEVEDREGLDTSWVPPLELLTTTDSRSTAAGIAAGQALKIPLGETPDGQVLWWDVAATPHAGVLGGTNSGKSWMLLSWLTALGVAGQQIVVIDGKNSGDFTSLLEPENACSSGVRAVTSTEFEAFAMLLWVQAEYASRKKTMAALKRAGIRQIPFPRLIVCIDEIAYLMDAWEKKTSQAADGIIDQLLKAARSVGIHLILAAQNPVDSAYPNRWLANLGLRVAIGARPSPMIQRKVLDGDDALKKYPSAARFVNDPSLKGKGLVNTVIDGEPTVASFRSAHVWSPTKGPSTAVAGWAEEEELWRQKTSSEFARFGFKFPDDLDSSDPESFSAVEVVALDNAVGEPIPEVAKYDLSSPDYVEWDGMQGISLGGDFV